METFLRLQSQPEQGSLLDTMVEALGVKKTYERTYSMPLFASSKLVAARRLAGDAMSIKIQGQVQTKAGVPDMTNT